MSDGMTSYERADVAAAQLAEVSHSVKVKCWMCDNGPFFIAWSGRQRPGGGRLSDSAAGIERATAHERGHPAAGVTCRSTVFSEASALLDGFCYLLLEFVLDGDAVEARSSQTWRGAALFLGGSQMFQICRLRGASGRSARPQPRLERSWDDI